LSSVSTAVACDSIRLSSAASFFVKSASLVEAPGVAAVLSAAVAAGAGVAAAWRAGVVSMPA
jgi:hypothetical protein